MENASGSIPTETDTCFDITLASEAWHALGQDRTVNEASEVPNITRRHKLDPVLDWYLFRRIAMSRMYRVFTLLCFLLVFFALLLEADILGEPVGISIMIFMFIGFSIAALCRMDKRLLRETASMFEPWYLMSMIVVFCIFNASATIHTKSLGFTIIYHLAILILSIFSILQDANPLDAMILRAVKVVPLVIIAILYINTHRLSGVNGAISFCVGLICSDTTRVALSAFSEVLIFWSKFGLLFLSSMVSGFGQCTILRIPIESRLVKEESATKARNQRSPTGFPAKHQIQQHLTPLPTKGRPAWGVSPVATSDGVTATMLVIPSPPHPSIRPQSHKSPPVQQLELEPVIPFASSSSSSSSPLSAAADDGKRGGTEAEAPNITINVDIGASGHGMMMNRSTTFVESVSDVERVEHHRALIELRIDLNMVGSNLLVDQTVGNGRAGEAGGDRAAKSGVIKQYLRFRPLIPWRPLVRFANTRCYWVFMIISIVLLIGVVAMSLSATFPALAPLIVLLASFVALCEATRVDRTLLNAVFRRFEFYFFMGHVMAFLIFSAWGAVLNGSPIHDMASASVCYFFPSLFVAISDAIPSMPLVAKRTLLGIHIVNDLRVLVMNGFVSSSYSDQELCIAYCSTLRAVALSSFIQLTLWHLKFLVRTVRYSRQGRDLSLILSMAYVTKLVPSAVVEAELEVVTPPVMSEQTAGKHVLQRDTKKQQQPAAASAV